MPFVHDVSSPNSVLEKLPIISTLGVRDVILRINHSNRKPFKITIAIKTINRTSVSWQNRMWFTSCIWTSRNNKGNTLSDILRVVCECVDYFCRCRHRRRFVAAVCLSVFLRSTKLLRMSLAIAWDWLWFFYFIVVAFHFGRNTYTESDIFISYSHCI